MDTLSVNAVKTVGGNDVGVLRSSCPVLYVVIPCYDEEQVLPIMCEKFRAKLLDMIAKGKVRELSRILYVDDGSRDATWTVISRLAAQDIYSIGIRQSRNRGHQNAVLAGLMEARSRCDISISIDCDGQDDIETMEAMVDEYLSGSEVVYGVRDNRDTDSFFKRFTAETFYRLLRFMGVEAVFNHADYRLLSARVLDALADFKEVNLFLRGIVPLVGFKSSVVYYRRQLRTVGQTHYPFGKMLALAWDGITSFSTRPLLIIAILGLSVSIVGLVLILAGCLKQSVPDVTANKDAMWLGGLVLLGGLQIACLGVVGEYIGKIYLEVKRRPRYIISARTPNMTLLDQNGKCSG